MSLLSFSHLTECDVICHGIFFGQFGSADPAVPPLNFLPISSPLAGGAAWETEKVLMLCKHGYARAKTRIINNDLATNAKRSTTWAAVKKVNSIPANPVQSPPLIPYHWTMWDLSVTLSDQEGAMWMRQSSGRSPAVLLITLSCSHSFYNTWQIHFQIIILSFKEISEKVLPTELMMNHWQIQVLWKTPVGISFSLIHFHGVVR